MANRYEFNIEDIKSVIITTITDHHKYTIICNRKVNEDGTYSREFTETYSANEDTSDEGIIGVICSRCGTWNYYDEESYEIFKEDNFKNACPDCNPEYETSYDENDLIELISSYMEDEESFNGVSIFINGIHIE